MLESSLLLGITVLSFAVWLHWNDAKGWPNESYDSKVDNQYLAQRTRSRKRIHIIIGACGILILVAAFAGPGVIWTRRVARSGNFRKRRRRQSLGTGRFFRLP